jgi:hypothetical protein
MRQHSYKLFHNEFGAKRQFSYFEEAGWERSVALLIGDNGKLASILAKSN